MIGRAGVDWQAPTDSAVESVEADQPLADAAGDSEALRRSRRISVVVSLVLVAIAATLTVTLLIDPRHPWFQPFDDWCHRWIAGHRRARLTRVADVFAVVGSTAVTIPARLAVAALLAFRRRWTQLMAFAAAILVSELCIGPLKSIVDRPRPPHPLIERSVAFPAGHTLAAAIVAVGLVVTFLSRGRHRLVWIAVAGLVAASMVRVRAYLIAHLAIGTSGTSFPSGHAIAAAVTAFGIVVAFLPRGRRRLVWIGVAGFVAASMAWSRTYLAAHWATDTIGGICIGIAAALLCEVAFESTRTAVAERISRPLSTSAS